MSKFRDVKTLQKFASMQASIDNHFNPERRLVRIRLTAPGHGIQKDGANYLVPSNAQIEVEEDLRLSTQQFPTCPCQCSPDQGAFFWERFRAKSFNLERHLNRRETFKQNRAIALAEWQQLAA